MTFCVKCSEHEATIELLTKRHSEEMQCMKQKVNDLTNEVESLSLDLAFFNGDIINLSCNGK